MGRRWPVVLGLVVWAAAAALAVVPLLGSSLHRLGPGVVRVSVAPALHGRSVLSFPPLGRVSAPTHRGPVKVTAELREVDVQPIIRSGGRLDADTITRDVRRDLPGALRSAALRVALVGLIVGALAVALLPWRSPLRIAGGGVTGLLAVTALMAVALPGFEPTAFEKEPVYQGSLAAGGSLLTTLTTGRSSGLNARVDVLADKLASLYSASITSDIAASDGDVSILHISDVHLNPIGLNLARQMAESFKVDAVVDTGDTTSFGLPFEEPFSALFRELSVPYYWVAGNHDSTSNRAAIASAPGVTAIDRKVVDVKGVRILGFDDPVITTTRVIPREERAATMKAAEPALRRLTETERPDVVATHNPAMASAVAGLTPLVIAGHLHRSVLSAEDGTIVSVVGSTGATGLGSLTVEAVLPYVAEVLRFRGHELVAVDTIELRGTLGDFVVRRTLITEEIRGEKPDKVLGSDPEEPTLETMGRDEDGNPTDGRTSSTAVAGSSTTTTSPTPR